MKKLFPILQPVITIVFLILACIIYGLSLVPSILLFNHIYISINTPSLFLKAFYLGCTISLGFFMFGISLILIVGCIFRLLPIKPKPGIYPLSSL